MCAAQVVLAFDAPGAFLPAFARDRGTTDDAPDRYSCVPSATSTGPDLSDDELLRRSADGDKTAFGALYDRFSRPLYSFALRIVGQSAEAEDLVQEVFLELWNRAAEFDAQRARPFTWAVAIIRNKAVDRIRSRTRRSSIIERSAPDIAEFSLGADAPEAVLRLDATEAAGIVREAFATLPEEQRTPLTLAFFEGLSQTEIAEQLQQPLGTIKARIRRGLARLRERLAGKL